MLKSSRWLCSWSISSSLLLSSKVDNLPAPSSKASAWFCGLSAETPLALPTHVATSRHTRAIDEERRQEGHLLDRRHRELCILSKQEQRRYDGG